jgi:hypothetical protein
MPSQANGSHDAKQSLLSMGAGDAVPTAADRPAIHAPDRFLRDRKSKTQSTTDVPASITATMGSPAQNQETPPGPNLNMTTKNASESAGTK